MAKPAKPAEAVDADAVPVKKSKKKLFILMGFVVLLLAGGGAAAWYFTQGSHDGKEAQHEPPKPPVFLPLETFTVNLQGGDQYLQTDITLQVAEQTDVDAIKLQMPRVRSRLLTLLSSQDAETLASAESKKKLAKDVQALVNQPFEPKGEPQHVTDVLFTTFVIQ
ncbi:MAG TPA: flagellar basal body-associated protein FliL [Thiobacillus sp.]|nr:MAG: flagellar basal body-associated protein FliL [Hydrogenophilales bacterium 28-61-11]HQT31262.1 flagellar basal body-associated protein FliL [Thiobacillus sp.]HQT69836.1 flagellar basal body-associated protein FliL [Thiobacillus sp.]